LEVHDTDTLSSISREVSFENAEDYDKIAEELGLNTNLHPIRVSNQRRHTHWEDEIISTELSKAFEFNTTSRVIRRKKTDEKAPHQDRKARRTVSDKIKHTKKTSKFSRKTSHHPKPLKVSPEKSKSKLDLNFKPKKKRR